ncbi:hypothetical protein [Streptomyces sp. NPDC050287]|uniref:hypothetical protein n=1 Tax=Streptomyces sp. NPDC050287 TaxID=3365608 RepID=UPI00379DC95D
MSRTGAAVVLLLAGLLHLLACAHGPTPTGTVRADALPVASAVSCGPVERASGGPAAQDPGSGEGGATECRGADVPTVQPPREIAPAAAAAQHGLPGTCLDAPPDAVRRAAPAPARSTAFSDSSERARLGVWRT